MALNLTRRTQEILMLLRVLSFLFALSIAPVALAQTSWPNQQENDFHIKNFKFASGETLADLNIHYMTIGTAKRNAAGDITNAVLLLHGTGSSSKLWLTPSLANELFAAGQPLDAAEYFIVMPDAIGRAGSSKPSDGLKGGFPHYRYQDVVASEHAMVTEGLGIKHLRLVLGASMGGMQTFMWGYTYPSLMDGLVPIASQPIQMSGRNWIVRRIAIDMIKSDPLWNNGFYDKNPTQWAMATMIGFLSIESTQQLQKMAPTLEAGDALFKKVQEDALKSDANNVLWGAEAVMDYNPTPHLDKIVAPLMAINFADDEVNPKDLPSTERELKRIPSARFVLIPATEDTHGHYTYMRAGFWKKNLTEFIANLPKS
jgi:homoserine O-acetyltransferase